MSVWLLEHVFWSGELTGYGTSGCMKCYRVCVFTSVHEHSRAGGWGWVIQFISLPNDSLWALGSSLLSGSQISG